MTKLYKVTIKVRICTTVEVEADNEDDAIELAEAMEADASFNEYTELSRTHSVVQIEDDEESEA